MKGMTILVVPYCHADWAWTHSRRWHEMRYVVAVDEVLDIMAAQDAAGVPPDAPEAYRWYTDCWRTQIATFLQTRPERHEELRRRIAEGRIAICGGWANLRVNHVPGELFVRGMTLGRRQWRQAFAEADLRVHSDIVDIAVGHPQLPQLLRLAGYDYLQFWRPEEALNAKGIPHQFIWEGLDGTRIIAARGSYGGLTQAELAPEGAAERWEEVVERWWETTLRYKLEHTPIGLIWAQRGADDARPRRTYFVDDVPMDLPAVIREWNARETSGMRFATPVEAFAEIETRRDGLPVVSGTLDPIDVAYNAAWGGARGLWRLREDCAREIGIAEGLHALVGCGEEGLSPRPPLCSGEGEDGSGDGLHSGRAWGQAELDGLWRDTLLFSAHAVQWLFQDDFDEMYKLAQSTLTRARRAQQDALAMLAARVDCPDDAQHLLVNPLPREREVTVPVRLTFVRGEEGGAPEPLRLLDGQGREVPWQALRALRCAGRTWEWDALARVRLRAGGWTLMRAERAQPAADPAPPIEQATSITNGLLTLHFDRGRLMRIEDVGGEWVAPEETPFGHLRAYDVDTTKPLHVGPIVGRTDAVWSSWRVTEAGPLRWAMRSEGAVGACPAALEARLYGGERRVEFAAQVEWDGRSGFLAAHLPYPGPGQIAGDMPFCVEDKPLWDEPYVGIERTRPGMFIARSFADWSAGGRGLAYISHDGDRYFIMDRDANVLQQILINSVREPYAEWEEDVNRQMRGEGRHAFAFSVVPHEGGWREAGLWRLSEDLRTPVLQTRTLGRGELPMEGRGLAVSPETVALSACYADRGRVLVRVFDSVGEGAQARIELPLEVAQAQVVDLNGEAMDGPPVRVEGEALLVELGPWQIATVAVRLATTPAG
ncbi:MAG: hypothetical protein AB7Y46_04410 [Armatimonadota bacterium]